MGYFTTECTEMRTANYSKEPYADPDFWSRGTPGCSLWVDGKSDLGTAAYDIQSGFIAFRTPDFLGKSESLDINLHFVKSSCGMWIRWALCKAKANFPSGWGYNWDASSDHELMYVTTSETVSDDTQIETGMLYVEEYNENESLWEQTITKKIEILTAEIQPNTAYMVALWIPFQPTDAQSVYFEGADTKIYINHCPGLAYIDNGTEITGYQCYIDDGSNWNLYVPYIDNGTSWDMYS